MADATPELVSLEMSPWSARARWALQHHSIPYKTWTYTPIIGEKALRRKVNRLEGFITSPIIITDADGTLFDSWDIALWTDSHGRNPDAAKLFPEDKREDIRKWADKGDIVQGYLRRHFSELAATDKAMARQVAPAFVRGIPLIGGWLAGTAGSFAAKSIAGKFGDVGANLTLDKARAVLQELRACLADNKSGYILGDFTYADVPLAIAVRGLCPPGKPRRGLSPEGKLFPSFSQELNDEFQDLTVWADNVFAKHYPA